MLSESWPKPSISLILAHQSLKESIDVNFGNLLGPSFQYAVRKEANSITILLLLLLKPFNPHRNVPYEFKIPYS